MQFFIGIMSGTSLDGIDVALCTFENNSSQNNNSFKNQACQVIATHFLAYPAALRSALLALHSAQENELEKSILMGNKLATLYAEAVKSVLLTANIGADKVTAIGCHGQTVRHCPNLDPELGFTLQIGNAALLAELTDITVISDFRSRDIAAGGQGAPLVPAFHQAIFGDANKNRAIVNIGGIANITVLSKSGQVLGFDTGPGNMLLDSWAKLRLGKDYDKDGAWAATGVVLNSLLSGMLAEPYFAQNPPKSTGRDLFNDHWLQQHLLYPHLRSEDVACTLVALTAHTIHDAIAQDCGQIDEVYLCGGGARNTFLVNSLKEMMGGRLMATTDALGVGVDWVEAVAFAWLAKQTIENKPSNLPAATGAKGLRVLGAIYPK
jgi:anhydro-N-acetylmuramic acid kinase